MLKAWLLFMFSHNIGWFWFKLEVVSGWNPFFQEDHWLPFSKHFSKNWNLKRKKRYFWKKKRIWVRHNVSIQFQKSNVQNYFWSDTKKVLVIDSRRMKKIYVQRLVWSVEDLTVKTKLSFATLNLYRYITTATYSGKFSSDWFLFKPMIMLHMDHMIWTSINDANWKTLKLWRESKVP